MERPSEMLIRAALHDVANVFAAIQGVLDLTPPGRPLADRDRDRLEAVLDEGAATLGRARHLAMGTCPGSEAEEAFDWQAHLAGDLKALGVLYRRRISVRVEDPSRPWPGGLLRGYLRAAVKQVLPYVQGDLLELACRAGDEAWTVGLSPIPFVPESLLEQPEDKPGDISGRFALRVADVLRLTLSCENGTLTIRIPRP